MEFTTANVISRSPAVIPDGIGTLTLAPLVPFETDPTDATDGAAIYLTAPSTPTVSQTQLATFPDQSMSRSPEGMVNSSPAVTAFAVIVPDPRKFPELEASHSVKCV